MPATLTPNAAQQTRPMRLYKDAATGLLRLACPYVVGDLTAGVFTPYGSTRATVTPTANTVTIDTAYFAAVADVAAAESLTFSAPFGAGTDTFIEVNG